MDRDRPVEVATAGLAFSAAGSAGRPWLAAAPFAAAGAPAGRAPGPGPVGARVPARINRCRTSTATRRDFVVKPSSSRAPSDHHDASPAEAARASAAGGSPGPDSASYSKPIRQIARPALVYWTGTVHRSGASLVSDGTKMMSLRILTVDRRPPAGDRGDRGRAAERSCGTSSSTRRTAGSPAGRPTTGSGRGATRSSSASAGAPTRTGARSTTSTTTGPRSSCWPAAATAAQTWSVERPEPAGRPGRHARACGTARMPPDYPTEHPVPLDEPIDFTRPDFAMTVRMENSNNGVSRYYYSYDRGHTWRGPVSPCRSSASRASWAGPTTSSTARPIACCSSPPRRPTAAEGRPFCAGRPTAA